ncbi:MAG: NTP transferase domain-containing protein [Maricaulaceae bacterium]|nr:NTP transferase domain-containing protein [Maricaulaceae bacterium]
MRALLLCAGQGTRLRPLTDDRPKCLVELLGKPLLGHQFDALSACGLTDVSLVTGYAAGQLESWGKRRFHNARFEITNMVESLFCARGLFDGADDLIVGYSDIVYEPRVLQALIDAPGPAATVIDRSWRALWSARMDDPLSDAETLKLNPDGTLREIGLKPKSYDDIEGQYVGLTKFTVGAQKQILAHYDALDRNARYDGRSFEQMFMTSFLTGLIGAGLPIQAAMTDGGWLEVDTVQDLEFYEGMQTRGELARFWRPARRGAGGRVDAGGFSHSGYRSRFQAGREQGGGGVKGVRTDLVVLGAGRPTGFGFSPGLGEGRVNRSHLRWVREAVNGHVEACHFIAGYAAESDAAQLGDSFRIEVNPRWKTTGSAASLLAAQVPDGAQALVCYADIVFRQGIVARLLDDPADVCLAIDTAWRRRYAGRTRKDMERAEKVRLAGGTLAGIGRQVATDEADAEFAGLVKLSPRAMAAARAGNQIPGELRETGRLTELIAALAALPGFTVATHDVMGDWAELDAPQDLSRFVLGTKAETLDRLKPLVRTMRVEDQVRFTVAEWEAGRDGLMEQIRKAFGGAPVIVRSSARSEDSWSTANAGAYDSIAHVDVADDGVLGGAVDAVIASYGARNGDDQVLVQPMLTDVVANGVVFTRTLSHGAPYFVVNYDETHGRTDGVTAGLGDLRILYMHHDAEAPPQGAPAWTAPLVAGARELIGLVGYDTLDIEFAVTGRGEVCLLQLRPIAVNHDEWAIDDALLKTELTEAASRFKALSAPPGFLPGGRPVFGVMPDWNPAEIVGTRPSLLSISLYRYLICDETWARQRAEYGYRDVRPQPLIVSFAGHPYVNVRASFSSFIPARVPDALAAKLVEHYLNRLVAEPALHDKVEFNIAFTCLSFDFHDRAKAELEPVGFTEAEIETLREGLADVTHTGMARFEDDLKAVETMAARHAAIMARPMHPLQRACALLEDCRRFGTLPFAHLARGGFVAATLMRSAAAKGFISRDFLERYFNSISTVAKEFVRDGGAVSAGRMAWDDFLDRYGHLRPGTYDILSPAYRDRGGRLLKESLKGLAGETGHESESIDWPDDAWAAMQDALAALGLDVDFEAFDRFVRANTEGREYAKFVFTRNLSQALDDLAAWGEEIGVTRQVLADVAIESIFGLRAGEGFGDPAEWLKAAAEMNQSRKMLARNAELPPLIHAPDQFFSFFFPPSEPNFITSKAITCEAVFLGEGGEADPASLKGKIVVIPQADPGFDWLFGCEIAGLITQYGGANSHMAIRAAEFGAPAAIGVGEILFEKLREARLVLLDCANRKIDVLG